MSRMHSTETLNPAGEGVQGPCAFRKQVGNVNLKSDDVWICNSVNKELYPKETHTHTKPSCVKRKPEAWGREAIRQTPHMQRWGFCWGEPEHRDCAGRRVPRRRGHTPSTLTVRQTQRHCQQQTSVIFRGRYKGCFGFSVIKTTLFSYVLYILSSSHIMRKNKPKPLSNKDPSTQWRAL